MKLDLTKAVEEKELNKWEEKAVASFETLVGKTGAGSEFTGWVDLPVNYDKEEFQRIKKAAEKIRKNSQCLISIGIGGSYLGAKAVISALTNPYDKSFEVLFAGNHMSSTELVWLMNYVKDKDFSINVISKSGTTTEPAIAFRFFKKLIEEKYGPSAKERIFVTTDKKRGALKQLAEQEGYETFVVPDEVGGRYSVLTAVGLLPIAAAGIDIEALMEGAAEARSSYTEKSLENLAIKYAAARKEIETRGKVIEILVNYEPRLSYLAEWFKQLYGESEGKEGKGIFLSSVTFTTDLHSLGQMIQDGRRNIFETVISVEKPEENITIFEDEKNLDGLNYLTGKDVDYVNKKAMEGTIAAHVTGKVPNIKIDIERISAKEIGHLMYFFMLACGISGYINELNPFDQPGVEMYKSNMFKLLGK